MTIKTKNRLHALTHALLFLSMGAIFGSTGIVALVNKASPIHGVFFFVATFIIAVSSAVLAAELLWIARTGKVKISESNLSFRPINDVNCKCSCHGKACAEKAENADA